MHKFIDIWKPIIDIHEKFQSPMWLPMCRSFDKGVFLNYSIVVLYY